MGTDLCYLYKVTHKVKPIVYIGLTNDPNTRFREHKNDSSNKMLRGLIKELGVDSFVFSIISQGQRSDIEELEALCIIEAKHLNRLIVCNILNGSVFTGESTQLGETHWNARFKEADILDIRSKYASGGITQKELGKIYGVSNKVISKITSGNRWRSVPGILTNNSKSNKVANRRKLSDEQVSTVRYEAEEEYLTTGTLCIPEIAEIYGVSRQSMRLLLKGISFPNLLGPILGIHYYKDFGHGN